MSFAYFKNGKNPYSPELFEAVGEVVSVCFPTSQPSGDSTGTLVTVTPTHLVPLALVWFGVLLWSPF